MDMSPYVKRLENALKRLPVSKKSSAIETASEGSPVWQTSPCHNFFKLLNNNGNLPA